MAVSDTLINTLFDGRYRIVRKLGMGGMANVYLAEDEVLGRRVAIKILNDRHAGDEQFVERFRREAKNAASLSHPNIVSIYDRGEAEGTYYIAMEYLDGRSLKELIVARGPAPIHLAVDYARQILAALRFAHRHGIVHRDIKPANVMLSRAGGVKVMDFGIARDTSFGDLTEAGTGIGTPAYMSPEQVLGDKLDARSDIFSLGVVLYQMVTGKKPFVEDERRSAMHKIRLEKHVGVRKLNPEIPRELERIIDRCLEKQPRDRWRSAQHAVMALERFLAKHVEMNHHARLVLFLRAQNVITELEAEEYLNPAALGGGGVLAGPTNMQARHAVRGGLVAHAVTLGVLALMLGLIHVAPLGATPHTRNVIVKEGRGFVRLHAFPWAAIEIDGKAAGTTPMGGPVELAEGTHTIRFLHDWYAPIEQTIEVAPTRIEAAPLLAVDFCTAGTLLDGKTAPIETCGGKQ